MESSIAVFLSRWSAFEQPPTQRLYVHLRSFVDPQTEEDLQDPRWSISILLTAKCSPTRCSRVVPLLILLTTGMIPNGDLHAACVLHGRWPILLAQAISRVALAWRIVGGSGPRTVSHGFGSVAILLDSEMAMSSAHGDFNLCEAALSNTRSCRRSRKHNSCNDGISQEL